MFSRNFSRIRVLSLVVGLAACGGEVVDTPRPVCRLPRPGETQAERSREPSNQELLQLVLGESAERGARAPAAECSGERIALRRTECDSELTTLPAISVGDDEIITRRVSDTEQLVWIITHSDGLEGEGPVALIEKRERDLVVRALGVLRADRGRPRLRLAARGALLVAESERCRDQDDATTCERTAHLLARNGDRFDRVPLRDQDSDRCITGPQVALSRRLTRELPDGWQREFELSASWEEQGNRIVIHETVTMNDSDPRVPAIPPRPFRQVSRDRVVAVDSGMRTDVAPLLDLALVEFGSVRASAEAQD